MLSFFAAAGLYLESPCKSKTTWNCITSGNKSDDNKTQASRTTQLSSLHTGLSSRAFRADHSRNGKYQVQRTPLQTKLTQSSMSLKKQVLHMLIAGDVNGFTGAIETIRASDCCVDFCMSGKREAVSSSIPQYQYTGCHQGVSQEGPDRHEIHKIFQVEEKGHNSCRRRRWEREEVSVTQHNMHISGALTTMQHTCDCCSGLSCRAWAVLRWGETRLGAWTPWALQAVPAQPHLLEPEEPFTRVNASLLVSYGCVHPVTSNE